MGTGIISTLLYTLPHHFRGLPEVPTAFYLLNVVLFVTFAVLSIGTDYIMHPWIFYRMVRTPSK